MPEPTETQGTPPEKEYIFTERVDYYVEFTDQAIQDEETLARLTATGPTYPRHGTTEPAGELTDRDSASSGKTSEK
jgi:hypothetical protein